MLTEVTSAAATTSENLKTTTETSPEVLLSIAGGYLYLQTASGRLEEVVHRCKHVHVRHHSGPAKKSFIRSTEKKKAKKINVENNVNSEWNIST